MKNLDEEIQDLKLAERLNESRLQERFDLIKIVIAISWSFISIIFAVILFTVNDMKISINKSIDVLRDRITILENKK